MSERDVTVSVGACLRALREARKGSLEEMARATRVSSHQLEALESDRFSELPAPVFVKGFIRAYCHFLGEPADEALRRYRDLVGEQAAPERGVVTMSGPPARSASPLVISLVLLIVFGFGLLAVNLGFRRGPKPAVPELARIETPSRPEGPPVPPVVAPAAATPEIPAAQRLVVRAIEPTWIRIQTDDGRVVEELLPLGATREWTAEKRFLLTVGNAGGIEIELNGRPMPRLGERGAVIRQLELPQAAAAGS